MSKVALFSLLSCLIEPLSEAHVAPHTNHYVSDLPHRSGIATQRFDFIVVGGGAAGCVAAATLAESGYRTLLIERGGLPTGHSESIYGAGLVINDHTIVQDVVTTQGVRSQVAAVLGGGTAVNYGIWIEEDEDFYHEINDLIEADLAETEKSDYVPSANFPLPVEEMQKALEWARSRLNLTAAPERSSYSDFLRRILNGRYGHNMGASTELWSDSVWRSYSLFNLGHPMKQRRSADVLVEPNSKNEKLVVLLNTTVDKIIVERSQQCAGNECTDDWMHEPRATCVRVRRTQEADIETLGRLSVESVATPENFDSFLAAQEVNMYLNEKNIFAKQRDFQKQLLQPEDPYTICLDNAHPANEILLAAGALSTPYLLMRSGIGPPAEVEKLKLELIQRNDAIGQRLYDRIFVPFVLYEKTDNPKEVLTPEIVSVAGMHVTCEQQADEYFDPRRPHSHWITEQVREESCSWNTYEEMSGGRLLEGFVMASRIFLPVSQRNGMIGDALEELVMSCSNLMWNSLTGISNQGFRDGKVPSRPNMATPLFFGLHAAVVDRIITETSQLGFKSAVPEHPPILPAECALLEPQLECLQRMVGWWYLLADPRSCGSLSIDAESGQPMINANYLGEPYDLSSAVEGVRQLLGIALDNQSELSTKFEKRSIDSCPGKQLNPALAQTTSILELSSAALGLDPSRKAATIISLLSRLLTPQSLQQILTAREPQSQLDLATYPVHIPDLDNYAELTAYVRSMAASMWHWVGSAPLGRALKRNFNVRGIRGLSVIDASALPRLTRMNPTSTILALARVAATQKAQARAEWI